MYYLQKQSVMVIWFTSRRLAARIFSAQAQRPAHELVACASPKNLSMDMAARGE